MDLVECCCGTFGGMMDRRLFLKLTGVVAAASALDALPVAAEGHPDAALAERARAVPPASSPSVSRLAIREPGSYRISGVVRLDEPQVQISGIANSQSISWSGIDAPQRPVASFTSLEYFDRPGLTPNIRVLGGRLESLAVVPVDFE
jgi:hypothetical protein